jgi:hypothetical protein
VCKAARVYSTQRQTAELRNTALCNSIKRLRRHERPDC